MDRYWKLQAKAITKEDYIEASNWLQELANAGNVDAMTELGICCRYGDTVLEYNIDLAKNLFEKTIDQGHPIAMHEYEDAFGEYGDNRHERLKKIFETGDPYVLGEMYYYGLYVETDYKKCIENHLKANNQRSLYTIGSLYSGSRLIISDLPKGFKYYLKSADMGYSWAQRAVASCYELGNGVETNLTKAYNWYKKAANQNCNGAYIALSIYKFKNFDLHEKAKNALLCLITIKKFRKSILNIIPMDVVKLIAKEIWNTRNDEEWRHF